MESTRLVSQQGQEHFSSPKRPDLLWSSPSLLFSGYVGSFAGIKQLGSDLTTRHHLESRLRMSGAILLLPSTLSSSSNIFRVIKSRRMRWDEHVARIGERRGLYKVFVGKSEGKRLPGRPRRRWEDNIKMDLQEVGCGGC